MNQILIINNNLFSNNKKLKNTKNFLYLFFISTSISIIILFYFLYSYFIGIYNNNKTNILKNKYNINSLYASNTQPTSLYISNNVCIIGIIKIPKINISYPIIENTNKDLLKISVCRVSGPFPNRIGNLCIAGHNYKNNSMFSNLYKLNIGDFFYITDLNNTKLKYVIYKKFVVKANNCNCLQDSNNVEATLITCHNNDNSKRLIIKAKMEG